MSWKEGRRVVDLAVLAKCMRCKQCGGLLDLEKIQRETRLGLASLLYIDCHCGLTNTVHTASQQHMADGRLTYIINVIASASLLQCGMLAYIVQNFFAALSIPLPVPPFDDICLDTSSGFADSLLNFANVAVKKQMCELSNPAEPDSVPATERQVNGSTSQEKFYTREHLSVESEMTNDGTGDDEEASSLVTVTFQVSSKPSAPGCTLGMNGAALTTENGTSELAVPDCDAGSKKPARVKAQNTAVMLNTSSTEKPFGCGVCFKAYRTEDACHAHIQGHIGNKSFLCEECGKGFVCSYNLKLHRKEHTGDRPHRCSVCGKQFIREFTLRRHLLNHKGQVSHTCDQCGEGFSSRESLKRHRRLHTGERPFQCDQCDKQFRGESNLYAHRRRHFGIKPYKCPDCDAAFVESTHLNRHRRTHTGEQPYVCEICGVRYTQSGTLAAHRKKHTGEPRVVKKLQCSDCGKIFHSYTQLKRHKRVHSGEKPYACEYCQMSFTQSSSLKAHRRIHTGERPFSCDQCGEAFLYPRTLKRHKKKHLDDPPPARAIQPHILAQMLAS